MLGRQGQFEYFNNSGEDLVAGKIVISAHRRFYDEVSRFGTNSKLIELTNAATIAAGAWGNIGEPIIEDCEAFEYAGNLAVTVAGTSGSGTLGYKMITRGGKIADPGFGQTVCSISFTQAGTKTIQFKFY